MNQMRLAWTRENVAFANPCFNNNGRDMTQCEPTLAFQTYTTQQDNTAQSRINDAIQFDKHFSWFKSGWKGITTSSWAELRNMGAMNVNQGNMNGTFAFGQRRSLQRRGSVHVSRETDDPRRWRVASTRRRTT